MISLSKEIKGQESRRSKHLNIGPPGEQSVSTKHENGKHSDGVTCMALINRATDNKSFPSCEAHVGPIPAGANRDRSSGTTAPSELKGTGNPMARLSVGTRST